MAPIVLKARKGENAPAGVPPSARFGRPDQETALHPCAGTISKTPMQTFLDAMPIAKEKMIAA